MFSFAYKGRGIVRWILVAIIAVAGLLKIAILISYPIPPGSDPGLRVWSAWRLAILGERREPYPAFDVTLATLWMVCNGELERISSLFAVFLSATTVLPVFVFTKALTNHDGIALVSSFLLVFAFSVFEVLSWGGYTSILALWFISAIFAVLSSRDCSGLREKVLVVTLLSTGLLMSHFWSFFVYLAMIFTVFLAETMLGVATRRRLTMENAKICIGSALVSLLVSSYWWAPISAFLKDLVTPSLSGFSVAMRPWDVGYLLYFLQPNDFYNRFVPIGVIALAVQLLRRRGRWVGNLFVLVSWLLVPLALTQGYRLGISVDYTRLSYFPVTPIIILSSIGLVVSLVVPYRLVTAMARTLRPRFRRFPVVKTTKLVSLAILVYVLLGQVLWVNSVATAHFFQASLFYQTVRQPELKGILWLGFETSREANIAATSSLAWWINGLIGRNTIASMSLSFITAKWQIPATSAANIIVGEVGYQADNGLMLIEDSNPSVRERNPVFAFNTDGGKETVAIFGDDRIIIFWNGEELTLSEFRVLRMSWLPEGEEKVSLETEYQLGDTGLRVLKSIRMRRRVRFVEVDLEVHAPYGDVTGIAIEASYGERLNYDKIIKGRIRRSDLKWAALIDEERKISLAVIAKKWMRVRETQGDGRIDQWRMKFYSRGGISMHAVAYIGAFKYVNEDDTISQIESYSRDPLSQESDGEDRLIYTDYLSLIEQFQIDYIVTRPETARKFEIEPKTNLVYNSNRVRFFSVS